MDTVLVRHFTLSFFVLPPATPPSASRPTLSLATKKRNKLAQGKKPPSWSPATPPRSACVFLLIRHLIRIPLGTCWDRRRADRRPACACVLLLIRIPLGTFACACVLLGSPPCGSPSCAVGSLPRLRSAGSWLAGVRAALR
ncbi:hypothetical protein BDA96_02G235300 [Sorghum bicolor]|uniref:Uncharacterized protein n=1 Tax=Sorghum bicolor TaxID=4558 RepID=A0A921UTU5_SORBI|nr:hypothetical protein BDA96_02G235300 [Sorghum bicolor]